MPLPAPHLDDRRFQDFVDDAKRLVQRRLPAWTDHNVHDPGITLIEAVATIADQLGYRLNQVPERHHRKFLDLLGITLRPPSAATCDVTFRLTAPRPSAVRVPARTGVATRRTPGEQVVGFTTLRDLDIPSVRLTELRAVEAGHNDLRDLLPTLARDEEAACFSPVPRPGDRLYVGLSAPAPAGLVLLRTDSRIEGIGVLPDRPPLRWEAYTPAGWTECELEEDGTGGLNRPGDILLHLPAAHAGCLLNGVRAAWLRAVVTEPDDDRPPYSRTPVLSRLSAACLGGTTAAVHAERVDTDLLGEATGGPGAHYPLARRPVLDGPELPLLEVSDGDGWQPWTRVAGFADSRREDPHYTLDQSTGELELGPAVRAGDGTVRAFGRIPPEGAMLRLTGYWVGGGAAGNLAAGALSVLRSPIPFVRSVTNRRPATGGRDAETVEEAKMRAARTLRSRGRAVTAEDFEAIAAEAAGPGARVRCVPPAQPTDPVRVLIVPDAAAASPGRIPFPLLTPDEALLRRVAAELDARRLVGVRVVLEPPRYQGVTVAVLLRPRPGHDSEDLRTAALARLYLRLHPLLGGPDGAGWPFGRPVTLGDVHAALAEVEGLGHVEDARLYEADPVTGARGAAGQHVAIGPDVLPFSYDHQVQVRP
ncbi:putative baseplate assembly protein [Kitasatospora sp. NPDC049285]|uniref:putative baseplate assembly protein n=1 Tax=Kitasatospora sp. NPDC049285 TaxID=3157096 RepID=UPI00342BDD14